MNIEGFETGPMVCRPYLSRADSLPFADVIKGAVLSPLLFKDPAV